MESRATRGVSPVVGCVVLVGVVAALAGGVFAAGMAMDRLGDPPPAAVIEGDDIGAACRGCGPTDQVVRLHHRRGDPIEVSEIELVVTGPGGSPRTRLVGLPLSTNCLRNHHVEGRDLFDGRCGRVDGAMTAVGSNDDGTWSAGETIRFRLRKSAIRLDAGEDVTVRVVHTPSGTTVAERTLSVTTG